MRIKFGEISVNVKEVFFYNPEDISMNVCGFCKRENCPVPNKEVVFGCDSLRWVSLSRHIEFHHDYKVPYQAIYSTST